MWLAEQERDEIEKENERETLSKHWRKTRGQVHPYLLCRGWDSQTAGNVCLLLVWSMTRCHSMCYVFFFFFFAENGIGKTTHKAYLCQNTSVLTWSVQIHLNFMRKTYLIVLNTIFKGFSCNPNKSPLAYVVEKMTYSYFKQSLQAWFDILNLLQISGMNQTPFKCIVLYILC